MGYLTLRLSGVFFAIATLALAIVVQTLIVNWDYVGGSRGIYIIRPAAGAAVSAAISSTSIRLMLLLSWVAVAIARTIERSRLGLGSPRSATTSRRPRRAACRPCGSS